MLLEILVCLAIASLFVSIVPVGGGPELESDPPDPTEGADETANKEPSEEAPAPPGPPELEPEGPAPVVDGAGEAPKPDATPPAPEPEPPAPPAYLQQTQEELAQQRTDALREENRRLMAAGRAPAAGPAPAAPTADGPLVAGYDDADLDPQTRAVLEGQRAAAKEREAIRAQVANMDSVITGAREEAVNTARARQYGGIVDNLLAGIDVFQDGQNANVANIVKQDVLGAINAGGVRMDDLPNMVLQQTNRYAEFLKRGKKVTAKEKVDAAIERKAQVKETTLPAAPAGAPALGMTDDEKREIRNVKNPRRFSGIIAKRREEMQAAGRIGGGA